MFISYIIALMRRILGTKFFERPALQVAEELLGKYLVRKIGNEEIALPITEVEAYFGHDDEGSHAFKGETKRTSIMFGPAGYLYVYLIYGMYEMLNIVVDRDRFPAALLIRGAGDIKGPGKLTKYFNINRKLNGAKADKTSGLWFEDRGVKVSDFEISRLPRVGIHYAGVPWRSKPYRLVWNPRGSHLS
jgi:DNA-3-methyladenine glycosylase